MKEAYENLEMEVIQFQEEIIMSGIVEGGDENIPGTEL